MEAIWVLKVNTSAAVILGDTSACRLVAVAHLGSIDELGVRKNNSTSYRDSPYIMAPVIISIISTSAASTRPECSPGINPTVTLKKQRLNMIGNLVYSG